MIPRASGIDVRTLDHQNLHPSLAPVERHSVAFPWQIRVERIAHDRAVGVPHQESHRILNAYAIAKHALVPVVPVLVLGVQIECFELRESIQMQGKGIVLRL